MQENGQLSDFADNDYDRDFELKKQGLERILGKMYDVVGHAIIPFQVGGPVDLYYFPESPVQGTAFATMELILPDGSGPQTSDIGTYELVAFTKYRIGETADQKAFKNVESRVWNILSTIGHYSYEASLNPLETCGTSEDEDKSHCIIFDEYKLPDIEFRIGERKHGLLLCLEVHSSEMRFAMEHGAEQLLEKLKKHNFYPYSDLDREPVV